MRDYSLSIVPVKFANGRACRLGGSNCRACRDPIQGDWREQQTGMREYPCPHDAGGAVEVTPPSKVEIRPPAEATPATIAAMFRVWSTGQTVSPEVEAERKAICTACEYLSDSPAGKYCGSPAGCGCTVEARKVAFVKVGWADITKWQERANRPICTHPKRGHGMGWPKA